MLRILWVYLNAFCFVMFHIIPIRKRYKHPERYSIDEKFEYVGKLCQVIVKSTGLKVIVEGREHLLDVPVLYISNHPSMIDPYFLSHACERQLGATIAGDLWFDRIPILAPWFISIGSVFVDRQNAREGLKGINQAIENVKKGHSLILFPEGEITKIITEDILGEYQSGGLRIAVKAKAPIVPMVLIGTDKVYTAHEVIGPLKKGTIIVKILPAYTKHLTSDISTQQMAEELQKMTREVIETTEIPC